MNQADTQPDPALVALASRPDVAEQIAAYEADPAAHRRPRRRRHERPAG